MKRTAMFLLAMAMASGARADSVEYVVIGPSGLADCRFLETGAYTVVAFVDLTEPAKSLQLSAPTRCGGPGITWSQPVSGDASSTLTLDLGGCVSGSIALFTAQFNVDDCCPALLQGPSAGGIERTPPVLIGCDDTPRYLVPPCSTGRPSLTAPADGASTSVTPFMSWDHSFGDYCSETVGLPIFQVEYGTDPGNLDRTYSANETPHLTLPALAPETQYFWRVSVRDFYAIYTGAMNNFSEIRSFTTTDAVLVEDVNWSAGKILYR